jgi:hypothetical protein
VNAKNKAVARRRWGPKALNYNVLLHQEILATKHGATQKWLTIDVETCAVPEELDLCEGLAATLIDRIVLYKNNEASHNRVDAVEQRRK